jgi:hypothetical protein
MSGWKGNASSHPWIDNPQFTYKIKRAGDRHTLNGSALRFFRQQEGSFYNSLVLLITSFQPLTVTAKVLEDFAKSMARQAVRQLCTSYQTACPFFRSVHFVPRTPGKQ